MTRMTKREFGDHLLFMPTVGGGPERGFLYMGPGSKWLPVEGPLADDLTGKWKAGDFMYAYDVCPDETPNAVRHVMNRAQMFVVRGVKKRGGE